VIVAPPTPCGGSGKVVNFWVPSRAPGCPHRPDLKTVRALLQWWSRYCCVCCGKLRFTRLCKRPKLSENVHTSEYLRECNYDYFAPVKPPVAVLRNSWFCCTVGVLSPFFYAFFEWHKTPHQRRCPLFKTVITARPLKGGGYSGFGALLDDFASSRLTSASTEPTFCGDWCDSESSKYQHFSLRSPFS
jgi:hypothetical protein